MDRHVRAIVSHRLPNAEELEAGCGDWLQCCQAYIHKDGCATTKRAEETLEPCPFCGGEAFLTEDDVSEYPADGKVWHVTCLDSCPVAPGVYAQQTKEDAIRKWDTRAVKSQQELLCDKHRDEFTVFYVGGCVKCWQENECALSPASAAPVVDANDLLRDAGAIIIVNEGEAGARVEIRFAELEDAQRLHQTLAQNRAAATAAPVEHNSIPLTGYERMLTIEWDKYNARRHELIKAERSRVLSENEVLELFELQWLAGIKRELSSGPKGAAHVEQSHDGWVTFGRVKVDLENETETFERIDPPVAEPRYGERTCKHCGKSIKNSPRRPNRWTHIDTASIFCESASAPSTSARAAAEEIDTLLVPLREYAKTPKVSEIAAIIEKHCANNQ